MSRWVQIAEPLLVVVIAIALFFSWRADRRDRAALATQLAAAQQAVAAADARQHDRDSQLAQTLASIAAQKRAAESAPPPQLFAALQRQLGLPAAPLLHSASTVAQSQAKTSNLFEPPPVSHDAQQGTGPSPSEKGSGKGSGVAARSEEKPSSRIQVLTENDSLAASRQSPACHTQQDAQPSVAAPQCLPAQAGCAPFDDTLDASTGSSENLLAQAHARQPNQAPPRAADAAKPELILPAEDLKPLYNFTLDCQSCQAKLAAVQGDLADERSKSTALAHERDAALQASKSGSLWRCAARAAKWFALGAAAGAFAAKSVR